MKKEEKIALIRPIATDMHMAAKKTNKDLAQGTGIQVFQVGRQFTYQKYGELLTPKEYEVHYRAFWGLVVGGNEANTEGGSVKAEAEGGVDVIDVEEGGIKGRSKWGCSKGYSRGRETTLGG